MKNLSEQRKIKATAIYEEGNSIMKDEKHYIEQRTKNLQIFMNDRNIDVAIIAKPENVYYLSDFNPILNSQPAFVILFKDGESCLLVHSIRSDHAKTEGKISNIRLYGKWGNHRSLAMDPSDAIRKIVCQGNKKKFNLAIELDYLSVSLYNKVLNKLTVNNIVDISSFMDMQKIVKDDMEIERIRSAAVLVDVGSNTTIAYLKKGYNEAEACTEGQYAMRKMWHKKFPGAEVAGFGSSDGGVFDTLHCWCMSGSRIAYGCDCPIHHIPQEGELVLPMTWAKINGYYAENERTLYVKKMDNLQRKVFTTIMEARDRVCEIVKPGITFEELYLAAGNVFIKNGFGSIMPGRVGHGIGLSAHEFPSLIKGNLIQLKKGMVFTVEPGLMSSKWGGVRISDTILITDDGYEILTKSESGMLML